MRQSLMAVGTGFLGGLVASWLILVNAPAWSSTPILSAQYFFVESPPGVRRAMLGASDEGTPLLVFFRQDGKTRSSQLLMARDGRSTLSFFNDQDKVVFMVNATGAIVRPGIRLLD